MVNVSVFKSFYKDDSLVTRQMITEDEINFCCTDVSDCIDGCNMVKVNMISRLCGAYGVKGGNVAFVEYPYNFWNIKELVACKEDTVPSHEWLCECWRCTNLVIDIASSALSEFFGDVKEVWIAQAGEDGGFFVLDREPEAMHFEVGSLLNFCPEAALYGPIKPEYEYILVIE